MPRKARRTTQGPKTVLWDFPVWVVLSKSSVEIKSKIRNAGLGVIGSKVEPVNCQNRTSEQCSAELRAKKVLLTAHIQRPKNVSLKLAPKSTVKCSIVTNYVCSERWQRETEQLTNSVYIARYGIPGNIEWLDARQMNCVTTTRPLSQPD